MVNTNCLTCGNEFEVPSKHRHQRYCSNTCAGIARRRAKTLECPICGKLFTRRGKRQARYCSVQCMSIGYQKPANQIPCAYCGTLFYPNRHTTTHCSPSCSAKDGKKHRIKTVVCICAYCGKREQKLTKQRRKYCSPECKHKDLAGKPSYRRFTQKQKETIKQRDRYCCVKCGSSDRVQVDHITPLALGGENRLSNGQTLCHKHHWEKTVKDRALCKVRRLALKKAGVFQFPLPFYND